MTLRTPLPWPALCLLGLACGCGPSSPPPAREPGAGVEVQPQVPVSAEEKDRLVRLVKEAPHAEDGVPYGEWLETQLAAEKDAVLFRDWSVTPRGGTRFEVRFIYTLMGQDSLRRQKGFSWNVDALLNVVTAPRELSAQGGPRSPAAPDPERRKALQDQYYSLE